jgi:hypothetical protein
VKITAAKKLNLKAGANTVKITASWGWMLFDYIDFEAYVDTPFSLNSAPVTKGADARATKLYNFLKGKFQKGCVSRVMTLQGNLDDSFKENNWVHTTTGKNPAIVGLDFMHQVGKNSAWYVDNAKLKKSVVNDAVADWKRGGIPALCWHWRDPSHDTDAFYSPSSNNNPNSKFDADHLASVGSVLRDCESFGRTHSAAGTTPSSRRDFPITGLPVRHDLTAQALTQWVRMKRTSRRTGSRPGPSSGRICRKTDANPSRPDMRCLGLPFAPACLRQGGRTGRAWIDGESSPAFLAG